MRHTRYISTICLALFGAVVSALTAGDRLDELKEKLSRAGCIEMKFLSIVESNVFDVVDTVSGAAMLAADGRYRIDLGTDQYVYDGDSLYSYSATNSQVTVEHRAPGEAYVQEVSFLARLDELYKSHILKPGMTYRLVRRSEKAAGVPDSLVLELAPDSLRVASIEYYDINEELNRLIVLNQDLKDEPCPDSAFEPSYPDSVEIIELF
jgi:outer membrane lipoprotein-sorting protein